MMSKKNIGLVVALVLIVGAIAYIESTKVAPTASGGSAAPATPQPVNIDASASSSAGLATLAAQDVAAGFSPAIEIAGPTGFINASSMFNLKSLVGNKVVLLDFWTYSCINCIRTLPYLKAWYDRYHAAGLEIVGIHTPEFDFEKQYANVAAAVKQFGIAYPVVLDSNYGTWNAYQNRYWPHEFLIDLAGYVVHDQIGEGNYAETESLIQKLLAERSSILGTKTLPMPSAPISVPSSEVSSGGISPETYFGSARNQHLANGVEGINGDQTLQAPLAPGVNRLYLVGSWNFQDQFAKNNTAGAEIIYHYRAAKVYFVGSAPKGVTIEIRQDGHLLNVEAGDDVKESKVTIGGSRLYNLIKNPDGLGEHTLEIKIDSPGLEAYTFTFG